MRGARLVPRQKELGIVFAGDEALPALPAACLPPACR